MARTDEEKLIEQEMLLTGDLRITLDDINYKPVDMVEVVRCKDCRHLEILNGKEYYARCKWHGRLFDSFGNADIRTWFCADGERRDDEQIH